MPTSSAYTAAEIISITNAIRQTEHLEPLHPHPALTQAAITKATAMISAKSWSHNTPDQTSWYFIDTTGYKYSVAGENLARNFDTATDVIDAWLNSPSHRNNLLSPQYTQIGVAVVQTDGKNSNSLLVVQYLATPLSVVESTTSPVFNPTKLLESVVPPISFKGLTIIVIAIALLFLLIKKQSYIRKLFKKTLPPDSKHWRA